eukprot:9498550-Pyramimonas_sp.AAC.1
MLDDSAWHRNSMLELISGPANDGRQLARLRCSSHCNVEKVIGLRRGRRRRIYICIVNWRACTAAL